MPTQAISVEQLREEVVKIAEYIEQAKGEIAAISSVANPDADKNLSTAAVELAEVVRHTEEATNVIMDNAEAIIRIAGGIEGAGVELNTHGLAIMEACSFQDITGQRIKKVLKTFDQIELRIANLIKLFGGNMEHVTIRKIDDPNRRPDEDLMDGPQLAKNKPSQDDIDKLFNAS